MFIRLEFLVRFEFPRPNCLKTCSKSDEIHEMPIALIRGIEWGNIRADPHIVIRPQLAIAVGCQIVFEKPGFDEWCGGKVLIVRHWFGDKGTVIELRTSRFQFTPI